MKQAKVCVVITTYKRNVNILGRAIMSVLNQSFKDFMLVIVDDSPDNYPYRDEVKKYIDNLRCSQIIYIRNVENLGACKSRNVGISECDSEYVAFLDDDDEWLPTKLEEQISILETNENIGLVYCDTDVINEVLGTKKLRYNGKLLPSGWILDKMFYRNIIGSCSFPLIRRSVFCLVGEFDESMPALQDWDLWMRIAAKREVEYINKALCRYYFHEGERISGNPYRRAEAYEKMVKKQQAFLCENRKVFSDFCLAGTFFYSNSREFGKALKYLSLAIYKNPFNMKRIIPTAAKMIGRIFVKAKIR